MHICIVVVNNNILKSDVLKFAEKIIKPDYPGNMYITLFPNSVEIMCSGLKETLTPTLHKWQII